MMTKDFRPLPKAPPIAQTTSLAWVLEIDSHVLKNVSENIESHWRNGKSEQKPDGSIRVTHSGSPALKEIHQSINRKIFSKVYYPNYLYGGLKNDPDGTTRNHISNAKRHQGKRLIISADIAGFFPSVNEQAIRNIWQCFFPFAPEVAKLLTRLTSYQNELPQGWGTSSYLAQLVFWKSEHLLYKKLQQRHIEYSRFIDDFTLSTNQTLTKENITFLFRDLALMCMHKGTKLKGKKCKVESRYRHQTVNKLGVNNGNISLLPKYRKKLRTRVHQFVLKKTQISSDKHASELSSIRGQINYLRKFHPNQARQLDFKLSK